MKDRYTVTSLAVMFSLSSAAPRFCMADAIATEQGAAAVVSAMPAVPQAAGTREPIALLAEAEARCQEQVQGYRCTFRKRERMNGNLGALQVIDVLYRAEPRSIQMNWIENANRVRRLAYTKGKQVNARGEEQAVVEPNGAIARLLVSEVNIPIHGKKARKASRYPVDQFGFHATLRRINRINERFGSTGEVQWSHGGQGTIDGRPTIKLVRLLPYDEKRHKYPDARLVVHLDEQWLAPVAVYSYADQQGRRLLGSYISTNIELNPEVRDLDFNL
jgi:hypothetical protein